MSDLSNVRKVFLSFAREDWPWVKSFIKSDWFNIAPAEIQSYLTGDNLEFGELGKWINKMVGEAAAVIAFISENYRQKEATLAEFEQALNAHQKGRLIFVPIMLDVDAKIWWAIRRKKGSLNALPDDYIYSDFTDGTGRLEILTNPTVQSRIEKIAGDIRDKIVGRASSEPSKGTASSPDSTVVVLGHPTNRRAEEVAAHSEDLIKAAQAQDLSVRAWMDGWLIKSAAREELGVSPTSEAVFVQPLAAGDASEHAEDVGQTGKRLAKAGIPKARVVLWLPSGQSDPEFEKRAKGLTDPLPGLTDLQITPALRIGSAADLAVGLRVLLSPSPSQDDPLVQVETVGSITGPPDPEATRLSKQLTQLFGNIVNGVISVDKRSPWPFWSTQFEQQIALRLSENPALGPRAIVAVHDLDVTPSPNTADNRKRIELKFQQMQDCVQQTDKTGKMKFFWAALLCKNGNALPFGRYPFGRYQDWRLLNFEQVNSAAPGIEQALRPQPASLGVFRNELCTWADSR
jgi:TIR domain